jgi:hypothetical protein
MYKEITGEQIRLVQVLSLICTTSFIQNSGTIVSSLERFFEDMETATCINHSV